jgi:hypothetical protein
VLASRVLRKRKIFGPKTRKLYEAGEYRIMEKLQD